MILSGFLILFFGFFILFGFLGLRSYRRLQRVGMRTTATVVDVEKQIGHDSDGKTVSYYPIVEFKTSSGDIIKGRSNSTMKKTAHRMAEEKRQIAIIYDPDKPTEFSKDSRSNEIIPMILLAVGVIGVVIGVLGLVGIIDMPQGDSDYWGP